MVELIDTKMSAAAVDEITVHLAYAQSAQIQHYLSIRVATGSTLYEALSQAGWLLQFADLGLWCEQMANVKTPKVKLWHVGVYSQKQPLSYQLQPHDRVEVYRSLQADPMSQRKSKSQLKHTIDRPQRHN